MDEITEEMRLRAISQLMDWRHRDPTVAELVKVVLQCQHQPSVGHLARFDPQAFDELFEECSGMVRNSM